jgi:hypothetical protein
MTKSHGKLLAVINMVDESATDFKSLLAIRALHGDHQGAKRPVYD